MGWGDKDNNDNEGHMTMMMDDGDTKGHGDRDHGQ